MSVIANINVGNAANDGTGNPLRTGGLTINANFDGTEGLRASVGGINAANVANTPLFTVPAGKIFICTNVSIRCTAASGVTSGPACGIGNIAGTNNIFASATLSALTTTSSIFGFQLVGMSVVTIAAGVVYLNLGTAMTGTSQTIAVDVIGYFI